MGILGSHRSGTVDASAAIWTLSDLGATSSGSRRSHYRCVDCYDRVQTWIELTGSDFGTTMVSALSGPKETIATLDLVQASIFLR